MYKYKTLVESLNLLRLSYKEQRNVVPDFIVNIQDDIVSDFYNAFILLPQIMEQKKVSFKAVQLILECYVQVDLNISNMELTYGSFQNHPLWQRVRQLATEALIEMKELSF